MTTEVESPATEMTKEQFFQKLYQECIAELTLAHQEKYDEEKAVKTAALFLRTQCELISFIEEVELQARQAKREVERIEAEKYHFYKTQPSDKKQTDVATENAVLKDPEVLKAKLEQAEAETTTKKYQYIFGVLKDGHVFFRNVGKKNIWEQ